MVLLDANFLLHMLLPDVPKSTPTDHKSVEQLIARLEKKRERILIPTPVLGEVLVYSGKARAQHVQIFKKTARFKIAPFDEIAAIQAAEVLENDLNEGMTIKSGSQSERAVIKVDRQIVQIAKIEQVRFIYSNDDGVTKLAKRAGIAVIDFETIGLHLNPLPLLHRDIPVFEEERPLRDDDQENEPNKLEANPAHPAPVQGSDEGRAKSDATGKAGKDENP